MLVRIHLAAVVVLVALVPLAPLGLWLYAKQSSVGRGAVLAKNRRVAAALPLPAGARLEEGQTLALYRWDVEGSLVPVTGYRTAFLVRLASPTRPDTIITSYTRRLHGWHAELEAVDCAVLGLRPGCGAATATFTRRGTRVQVDVAETLQRAQETNEYELYVSQ